MHVFLACLSALSRGFASALAIIISASLAVLPAEALARGPYAAIVIDADSGAVIHEAAADQIRYPASLTKMMTLLMVFEALDSGRLTLGTRLPVSAAAAAQPATKLGLDEGDTISVRDAVLGLITKSANDAAVVVAEALSGSEARFAVLMTLRAHRLGMSSTRFENASGLPDPDQVTTARDLAVLARALIGQYPHHYTFFATPSFNHGGVTFNNHNRWMNWYQGADGIKTGYIRASGFNLAASAVRDGRRLIGVVLGGMSPSTRDQEMARLLDIGFGHAGGLPEVREASLKFVPASATVVRAAAPQRTATLKSVVVRPGRAPLRNTEAWGVQVGSFSRSDLAKKAANQAVAKAPKLLADTKVSVAPINARGKQSYRARLVGLTKVDAREACRLLKRRSIECVELSPQDIRPTRLAGS